MLQLFFTSCPRFALVACVNMMGLCPLLLLLATFLGRPQACAFLDWFRRRGEEGQGEPRQPPDLSLGGSFWILSKTLSSQSSSMLMEPAQHSVVPAVPEIASQVFSQACGAPVTWPLQSSTPMRLLTKAWPSVPENIHVAMFDIDCLVRIFGHDDFFVLHFDAMHFVVNCSTRFCHDIAR